MIYDFIVPGFFVVFALLTAIQSIQYGLGKLGDPGPGFLPLFSCLCIGLLSLGELLSQIRKAKKQKLPEFRLGPFWAKAFCLMGVSFLYVLLLWENLGYLTSTTLWLISILWLGKVQNWKKILVMTGTLVIISYFAFRKMNLYLPTGILGF